MQYYSNKQIKFSRHVQFTVRISRNWLFNPVTIAYMPKIHLN